MKSAFNRKRGQAHLPYREITRVALSISAILLLNSIIFRQQPLRPPLNQASCLARGTFVIHNARIVTVSGADIENGTVVIRDGKIAAVGTTVDIPANSQTIDAHGLSIYPGMIDAGTSMGLVEVGQGAFGTVDTGEVGDLNPHAKAIIAVNPHSAHIAVTRVDGVTTALSLPTGSLISGQGALINLLGTTPLEMAVVPCATLVINYPRTGGSGGDGFFAQQPVNLTEALATANRQLEQIRKVLRDAEAYGRARDAYAKDPSCRGQNRI